MTEVMPKILMGILRSLGLVISSRSESRSPPPDICDGTSDNVDSHRASSTAKEAGDNQCGKVGSYRRRDKEDEKDDV